MRDSRIQKISRSPAVKASDPTESAEVQSALDAFRMARSAALLLTVVAAVVIASPAQDRRHEHIAASLAALAVAVYVARGGRRKLRSALSKSAERLGMSEPEARLHAEASFERLTWQDPTQAIAWVPYRASAEPSRDPVRELPHITITGLDRVRLVQLLKGRGELPAHDLSLLDRELARALVVPSSSIAPDVVTMNSRVRFADADEGRQQEVTLVYPTDAGSKRERVSVLSPLGSALLGLKAGQAIEWPFSDGHRERYRVLDVAYQPEAAGHFHL